MKAAEAGLLPTPSAQPDHVQVSGEERKYGGMGVAPVVISTLSVNGRLSVHPSIKSP
jgi:hypothetical protein